ncbi:MAG: class I SAM-dependent methyltransferase [Anaerolineae bacterium]
MDHYQNMLERYQTGQIPWDHELPPPEVLAYVPTLPPGKALDLGCGLGRAAIFMAGLGWDVDAVDFIPLAVDAARARAKAAGVSPRFHMAPVIELDFLTGLFDLALDVGCLHGLPSNELPAYHRQLLRLLKPDGQFMLFAHLRTDDSPADGHRWIEEAALRRLFDHGFTLNRVEYGTTQIQDHDPWKSAWFWFAKRKA